MVKKQADFTQFWQIKKKISQIWKNGSVGPVKQGFLFSSPHRQILEQETHLNLFSVTIFSVSSSFSLQLFYPLLKCFKKIITIFIKVITSSNVLHPWYTHTLLAPLFLSCFSPLSFPSPLFCLSFIFFLFSLSLPLCTFLVQRPPSCCTLPTGMWWGASRGHSEKMIAIFKLGLCYDLCQSFPCFHSFLFFPFSIFFWHNSRMPYAPYSFRIRIKIRVN